MNEIYNKHKIYIKLMISLKVDHSHKLPCHPTKNYIEEQMSIYETDRQHLSQNEDEDYDFLTNRTPYEQSRTLDNRTINTSSQIGSRLKINNKFRQIPNFETPQQIYETNLIGKNYQDSVTLLPKNIATNIMQKVKFIQDKVYLGLSNKGSNILQRLYKEIDAETHLKDQIKQNLDDLMGNIQGRLENDIQFTDQYVVHNIIRASKVDILKRKKDRKSQILKQQTFSVKRAGQELKQKINSFRESLDDQSVANSNPASEDYHLNSAKTKQAEHFIKKITRQQQQFRKKKREKEDRIKSLEVKSLQEKREFEQQLKQEKRRYLKRKIEKKKEVKEKQLEQRQKMNKEYKQFLERYKKQTPLFKKKQKQYKMNSIEEQIRIRQNVLSKLKSQKKSINLSELKEHEKRYLEFKSEKDQEKAASRKLMDEKPQTNYFKGKIFDTLVEEEEKQKQRQVKEDPKLIRSELIKKRQLYSKSVRQNHLPKANESKHRELQELMQKIRWTQKLKNGKKNDLQHKEQGMKNLRRVHEIIGQLRKQGKLIQRSSTIQYSTKPNYNNYLEELRQIQKKRNISIDFQKMADKDVGKTKQRAQQYEKKAKRRQLYVSGGSLDVNQTLRQTKKIDDEYLQSVKAKIAILNKLG